MAFLYGLALGIVHYLSDRLAFRGGRKLISFSSGTFVSYLILHLIPGLIVNDLFLTRVSLAFVLAGFCLLHLIERHVYNHKKSGDVRRELKEVHSIAFFFWHFTVGVALFWVSQDFLAGLLLFIPLVLITAAGSISLGEVHGRVRERKAVKIFLSLSTLLGILAGPFFSQVSIEILLGLISGILLYVVMVDSIQRERSHPAFFTLGVAVYALVIGLTWIVRL